MELNNFNERISALEAELATLWAWLSGTVPLLERSIPMLNGLNFSADGDTISITLPDTPLASVVPTIVAIGGAVTFSCNRSSSADVRRALIAIVNVLRAADGADTTSI